MFLSSPTRDTPQWHYEPDERLPQPDHDVLLSADTTGSVVDLVLDLEGMNRVLGDGPFRPGFDIDTLTKGPPDQIFPSGVPAFIDAQKCDWDNDVSTQSGEGGAVNRPTPAVTPQPRQVPASTPALPAPVSARPPLPDADAHGFVGYGGGRCLDTDLALAMGRTEDSLVVICQHDDEPPYYVGFGLGNRLAIVIPKASRYYDTGFSVNNLDTQYTITPESLTIYQPATGNTIEPMIEYWPS